MFAMLLGMCTGWGIGAAAMRAALAARDQTVLKATLLRAQQRYVSPQRYRCISQLKLLQCCWCCKPWCRIQARDFPGYLFGYSVRITHFYGYPGTWRGIRFLNCRSSVIYGVFLGFGSFLFALLRAYSPKLTIVSLFGSIVLDIFCVSSIKWQMSFS